MSGKKPGRKPEDLITEELFREAYQYQEVRRPPLKYLIAKNLRCTKNTLLNFFPVAKWISKYSIKKDIVGDIIAGVMVGIMHIPQGLAYAPLGKVEPVVGFYMAVFPVFIYMLLGTSRHISIGTFAVVCAMVGQIVMKYEDPEDGHLPFGTINVTDTDNSTLEVSNSAHYRNIEVGAAICLMVGLWQAALGFLKMGSLCVIMSESLVSGFTAGAAVHVISYQLKNLFGVHVSAFSGVLKLIYIYIDFFKKIKTVNLITMAISIVCISILLFFSEFVKPVMQKRFPKNKIPVPIELFVIILGILLSYFLKLSEKYNVGIVGYIPKGFPKPMLPPADLFPHLILDSLVVAVVGLAVNLSLSRIFAKKGFYTVSSNQEFIAYGIANVFASFFRCLPSAASLSRSTIQFAVGGKTQLASLFSIIFIIFILLCAGFLFEPVPYCVLSSIVVVSLKGLLMQIKDLCGIWRENFLDGIVWLGTFLGVVILDLDIGLGVGIGLSLLTIVFSSYVFQVKILGRVPNTNIFLDIDHYKSAQSIPNVLILQVTGNLNFINSTRFEKVIFAHLDKFSNSTTESPCIVLNMSGVIDVDPTFINSLRHIYEYLKKSKCDLYLTDCSIKVYRRFEICNIFRDIPKDQILASLVDAVEFLTGHK